MGAPGGVAEPGRTAREVCTSSFVGSVVCTATSALIGDQGGAGGDDAG
jgi:hypothetical protein